MTDRDSASASGKDDEEGELTLGSPRLALVWLAAVVLASLGPLASWLSNHISR